MTNPHNVDEQLERYMNLREQSRDRAPELDYFNKHRSGTLKKEYVQEVVDFVFELSDIYGTHKILPHLAIQYSKAILCSSASMKFPSIILAAVNMNFASRIVYQRYLSCVSFIQRNKLNEIEAGVSIEMDWNFNSPTSYEYLECLLKITRPLDNCKTFLDRAEPYFKKAYKDYEISYKGPEFIAHYVASYLFMENEPEECWLQELKEKVPFAMDVVQEATQHFN